MTLPPALVFLADFVPPGEAMRDLVLPMDGMPASADRQIAVAALPTPALQALAWLYLDRLHRAHETCQSIDDATGSHLHAIVHRREGDFGNALYWYRLAAVPDGEGAQLTRDVAAGDRSEGAVERQRAEWLALAARLTA